MSEGGEVYSYKNNRICPNDFDNNPRSNKPTIGAFEKKSDFDSGIEISLNFCNYDNNNRIYIFGKYFKKYLGTSFIEFTKESECLWKYKLDEIPDSLEYYFIVGEDKSIFKRGKKRKIVKSELMNLNLDEDGIYSHCSYSFSKTKNIFSLKCDF